MLDFVCVCVGGGGGRGGRGGGGGGEREGEGGVNYELLCKNHSLHYVMTNVITCKARLYSRILHIIPKSF